MNTSIYWKTNSTLQHITPPGDTMPEVGLFTVLQAVCIGSVFEFGCGYGRLAKAFDPEQYIGYDINPTAVKTAQLLHQNHKFRHEWHSADTVLAHTVLLHIPDYDIQACIDAMKAAAGKRLVIGEIMGRKWRRDGLPPVFNREIAEYEEMVGKRAEQYAVHYPRYSCNLDILVFDL